MRLELTPTIERGEKMTILILIAGVLLVAGGIILFLCNPQKSILVDQYLNRDSLEKFLEFQVTGSVPPGTKLMARVYIGVNHSSVIDIYRLPWSLIIPISPGYRETVQVCVANSIGVSDSREYELTAEILLNGVVQSSNTDQDRLIRLSTHAMADIRY